MWGAVIWEIWKLLLKKYRVGALYFTPSLGTVHYQSLGLKSVTKRSGNFLTYRPCFRLGDWAPSSFWLETRCWKPPSLFFLIWNLALSQTYIVKNSLLSEPGLIVQESALPKNRLGPPKQLPIKFVPYGHSQRPANLKWATLQSSFPLR